MVFEKTVIIFRLFVKTYYGKVHLKSIGSLTEKILPLFNYTFK